MKPKLPQTQIPFQVFGLWVVVRIKTAYTGKLEVHCPKGGTMIYGDVVATGDGFDGEARQYRPMPTIGTVIAVEESGDDLEGHYFFLNDQEYRIVHLDSIIINFLGEEGKA